jgi:hypothetical protein
MAGGDTDSPLWEALAQLSMLSVAPAKPTRNCQICQADQINPRLNIKFMVTTIQTIVLAGVGILILVGCQVKG